MFLYSVAVAAPILQPLTYSQPVEQEEPLTVGMPVLVYLGNRLLTGYILKQEDDSVREKIKQEKITVKPIIDLLSPEPVFPASMVPFFTWISNYYHYPIGEVISTALPTGINLKSSWAIRLTALGKKNSEVFTKSGQDSEKEKWLSELVSVGELNHQQTGKIWKKITIQRKLKKWQKEGLLIIEQVLEQRKVKGKYEKLLLPTDKLLRLLPEKKVGLAEKDFVLDDSAADFNLSKAEINFITIFYQLYSSVAGNCVTRKELIKAYPYGAKVQPKLEEKDLIKVMEQRVYRNPFGEVPDYIPPVERLSEEQAEVLSLLGSAIEKNKFTPFLLHGITGSGKTEVFLRAAQKVIDKGKSVIVLVPEIALASQLEAHFYSRFGEDLVIYHSSLSSGERLDSWHRAARGEAKIIIGARSAVFAPFADLGLIIVDEEHEPAYKQDDGLRYNGRDLAVIRAKLANCPVILGSATPSLVSYYHAMSGKYSLLEMQTRVGGGKLPQVKIVDLGKKNKSKSIFSDILTKLLRDNFAQGHQSLLFVNRRGYASFVMCRDCGHVVQCQHCQVSLTLHKGKNILICHYCGFSVPAALICPDCGTGKVIPLGVGSEKVEQEVRNLLPQARVARLDSDTATSRKKYLAILKNVYERETDIIIGTQMIAKGLHFPFVTLVGVVWADSSLHMPDYKAAERCFSLLSQVTGRTGRGELKGRVIIQTYQPDHYALNFARTHDYKGFYKAEISQRQELAYPPFSRLVNIRLQGKNETKLKNVAHKLGEFIRELAGKQIEVLGPAPSPLSKLHDFYRYQLLLKTAEISTLHQLCHELMLQKSKICSGGIHMQIDIDPESMM